MGGTPAPVVALAAAVVLALVACSGSSTGTPPGTTRPAKPRLVVSTPVLADVVTATVRDQAEVTTIVPGGTDPRGYRPTPAQQEQIAAADLVVVNGLGEEPEFGESLDAARRRGQVVLEVGSRLSPLPLPPPSTGPDPHIWLDPDRMTQASRLVADEVRRLPGVDPNALTRQRDEVAKQFARADEEIQAALLPLTSPSIVTDHDALGYFASRYGITVVGVLPPADASPAARGELAATMRDTGTRVVVVTGQFSPGPGPDLTGLPADTTAVTSYVETLGPAGSPTATLTGLLRTLAHQLAEAVLATTLAGASPPATG